MRQRIIIIIGLVAAALVASAVAFGSTLTTTATVTGTAGVSMNVPATASFSDTLDGVVDARGTGGGWNLQISATNFSDGAGHTLLPGTVTAASQACHSGSSCTAATNSGITLPLTITGTAAKFFNAAANTGLGKIDVTPTVQVAIPGNAYAGTYTSTVTLAAATGP
jgi:putative surface cell wall-binding protein